MPINSPYHSSMEKEIKKASNIINQFFDTSLNDDKSIPVEFIQNCRGLAFLTVVKAGFIWSGKVGTGIVIARLEDGSWSPPSGIGTVGLGFGAEIGGEIVDFMIILGRDSAVRSFKKGTQVSIGAGLDLAIGPFGRSAAANVNAGGTGLSTNYTYSHSKGLFAGIGLQGSTIMVRGDMNQTFYGKKVKPMEILCGHVKPPVGSCDRLYQAIQRAVFGGNRELASISTDRQVQIPPTIPNFENTTDRISNFSNYSRTSNIETKNEEGNSGPDPRLSRYSGYKTEKELYEQFSRQKKDVNAPRNIKLPEPAEGAETKEVFNSVINYIHSNVHRTDVQTFKEKCKQYGLDQITLEDFYSYLESSCAKHQLKELLPKLVRLLPSAEKRQAMWRKYVEEVWNGYD